MKPRYIVAASLCAVLAGSAAAQEKTYDWARASGETYLLEAGDFRSPHSYRPGLQGGNIQVDVTAQHPVTLAIAQESNWARAREHPELLNGIQYFCRQEHVMATTYTCNLPPSEYPMVLVIHDEREATGMAMQGVGQIFDIPRSARRLITQNSVQVTYYRWACLQNCNPPEFQSSRLAKEKYELTSVLKLYSLPSVAYDGEKISVKIKSQVPMMLAILPAQVAGQLYGKPEMLQAAVANSPCQQRGVQTMSFGCTFSAADGPQSLLVLPEQGTIVPKRKKAEIELTWTKCVAYCELLNK